ncbi:hypothetical protein D3Z50_13965 [Clostridiaceae bacterium]|nr:hypothetical protein [Clostridiaceae bacterium]
MTDDEKRAHDLALIVVAETLSRDFGTMGSGKNPKQKREALAESVLDEYNFFYDTFIESIK